jgi:hypothetical protein
VSYQLINQSNPDKFIQMNNWTWFGILELAEKYGWNPRGTVTPESLELAGSYPDDGNRWQAEYWGNEARLVLIEDALNLADALELAFIKYEPVRLPSLHPFYLTGENGGSHNHPPAIGVIQIMIHFCQSGAFLIEPAR